MIASSEPAIVLKLVFFGACSQATTTVSIATVEGNSSELLGISVIYLLSIRKMSDFEDEEGVDEPILDADDDEDDQVMEEV